MNEPEVVVGEISTVSHAVAAARSVVMGFRSGIWWRGQADTAWTLKPGVFRRSGGFRYEQNIFRRFVQRARSRHERCPPISDRAGWLFLAQHYRLPTRLLDWTESPLFALFFACQPSPGDGALFALSPFLLNKEMTGNSSIFSAGAPEPAPFFQALSRKEPEKESEVNSKALALITDEVDLRMLLQLSAFTIHGDGTALESRPQSEKYLLRFTIPSKEKALVLAELEFLGIRRSTIFPDLENLAADLAEATFEQR